MALIKCPECEQLISDKASKCPKCGYPIQEYLLKKDEKIEESTVISDTPTKHEEDIKPISEPRSRIPIPKYLVAVVSVLIVAIIAIVSISQLTSTVKVQDISIGKWKLTDSTEYSDYYEGTISSEQTKPFIAVIGEYDDEKATPTLIYVENGTGVIETIESSDDDPSIIYRPIGYLCGSIIQDTDIKSKYSDSDYSDWSYSNSTSCTVQIEMQMNRPETGLLLFDVINESNNEIDRNRVAVVIDGKVKYDYYASLPFKSRGIDISIEPKMFCKSDRITQEDYIVEKAYSAKHEKGTYSQNYSGTEELSFNDYPDGFLLYTKELKEGGMKENRNVVNDLLVFVHDGKCKLSTYDYADTDESLLTPKYEFNIKGYIDWIPLEKENT